MELKLLFSPRMLARITSSYWILRAWQEHENECARGPNLLWLVRGPASVIVGWLALGNRFYLHNCSWFLEKVKPTSAMLLVGAVHAWQQASGRYRPSSTRTGKCRTLYKEQVDLSSKTVSSRVFSCSLHSWRQPARPHGAGTTMIRAPY